MAEKEATHDSSRHDALLHLSSDDKAMMHAYGRASLASLIKDRHVLGTACFAAMGGLLFGVDQGLMSVTLVMSHFVQQFPEVDESGGTNAGFNKGLLTSMIVLGAFVGAFCASFVADHYSRRMSIRVGVIFFLIGSAIQTGSFTYGTLVAGRLVGGLGVGFLSMTCPLYISEISPPNLRGILLSTEEGAIVFGIVVAYYVTYGTRYIDSDWSFRLPFLLQIIPGLVLLVGSFVLPPSPRWLAMQGRKEECLTTLAGLRSRPSDDLVVQAEWLGIQSETEMHEEIRRERHPKYLSGTLKDKIALDAWAWIDTWRPGCWKRTLIGMLLMFFQQMVGINALIYYAPTLFEQLGLDYNNRLVQAGINNVCQLIGVCMSFFLIDRIGRRPLLIFGSFGMMVCMIIVGILTALFSNDWPNHRPDAKAAVAFLNIYMVIFGISLGPVAWSMPAELFPSSLRARGVAWSVMTNWLFNFIIGLVVPPMIQNTGYGTFVFFAVFAFFSGLFSIFVVPETMGKTLEQLDTLFNDRTGTADEERRNRINSRLAAEQAARLDSLSLHSSHTHDFQAREKEEKGAVESAA